jgi:hypothetical protein
MRKVVKRKKITIATSGKLSLKGGIRGPVEIPYMETIDNIGRMIVAGYKIYEHLSDGTKVLLTVQNFKKENGTNDLQTKVEVVKSAKELREPMSKLRQQQNNSPTVETIDIFRPRK